MDYHIEHKWKTPWYDKLVVLLVFLVPLLLFISLGLESAIHTDEEMKDFPRHDFRAIAHWFDPIFFQYNLLLASLMVLVVPSLAVSYIKNMAYRKGRRLYRDVPPQRRGEVRSRMERRASFRAYRGSVVLTTFVVLLGVMSLLFLKPDFSHSALKSGLDPALSTNGLLMGGYFELTDSTRHAYFSHILTSVTAFHFGFLGAYVYFISTVARAYFTLDLTPHSFVDGAIRMMVASLIALVLSFSFNAILPVQPDGTYAPTAKHGNNSAESPGTAESSPANPGSVADNISPNNSYRANSEIQGSLGWVPILAFFFGTYPKRAILTIERIATNTMRMIVPNESYRALPLSTLPGMSYSHELRLEREGFDNVENLSNADAVDLAIRTSFSYSQLHEWIDQAWLAAHLREDYPEFVRRAGIFTGEDLRRFLCTADSANSDGISELVAALTSDPAAAASWKVRLTALKMLLEENKGPSQKVVIPRPDEPKTD